MKTFTYTHKASHSWTSYTKLTKEQEEAIAATNVSFPRWAIAPSGQKLGLHWQDWKREPIKTTTSGYSYFDLDGGTVRIKIETTYKSPDYDKPNGNGEHRQLMIVRSDVPLTFEWE
ncbi:MAG: hypothetical protein ACRC62_15415 [Microcoleus sp.]